MGNPNRFWDWLMAEIRDVRSRAEKAPVVRWGTVTQASPLRVQLDGDMAPLGLTPQTAVRGLTVGDRVLCVEQNRRVIVVSSPAVTDDTGWVSSGVGFTTGSGWSLVSYRVRQRHGTVKGEVVVERTGGPLTADADGNLADQNGVVSIPVGWRATMPASFYTPVWRVGYTAYVGRYSGHGLDLVGGTFPGQTVETGYNLRFILDYFT